MQRVTRQRTAIIDILRSHKYFISAQDLHHLLEEHGERIGLATVYRNLQALAQSHDVDVVRQEDSDIQLFRYCGDEQHHHHLVCRSCGKTVDVVPTGLEEWANTMASTHGFTQVTHALELYGLCPSCTEERQEQ
ncbi:MAG: Fur family transcriptional regulator [Actinomycetaceae bacterium]|nr:transcriptional repressor [Arcanobacterium sp.]MDD7504472.1 Fur family transcriptional regulator [Actinomycetaceae bacterium]MDY6142757.1 Fur family transcriptional regulator [Arcanobacterium sp.]